MRLGIRQKLSLGFGGLLLIILAIGAQSVSQLTTLGQAIDIILRENYRSVIACQQMKEAIERLDSGVLFTLLGDTREGEDLIRQNVPIFEAALRTELANLTLPGEAERAERLRGLFAEYRRTLAAGSDAASPAEARRESYFGRLQPLFRQIKATADEILQLNQQNMLDANARASDIAAKARRRMYALLGLGALLAAGFVLFTGRWVLQPISRLTSSAEEIRRGNLDLVVSSDSHDEIGRLSEAFNDMASSLRALRRDDLSRLARIEHSTQQLFRSLPEAVAVVDMDGRVEVSTREAASVFGLRPGVPVRELGFDWMQDLYREAVRSGRTAEPPEGQREIQFFVDHEERYFHPVATPILDSPGQPTGVVLSLRDVTQQRQQDELKRGVISTVSHQLKTPLTSLRMAVYLLLEERVGPLTPKQLELLVAAREESDRLHSTLHNLLDLSRIESGRVSLDLRAVPAGEIAAEAIDSFRSLARDQGVELELNLPEGLPEVMADPARIGHVLANLLSNALKYTRPGGRVRVTAEADERQVHFSVTDTGIGIPAPHLGRVFEPFFRVHGQSGEPGQGLGLAIAREIVEAHGGTIRVESGEGRGSTFTFSLRRAHLDAGSLSS